jgi:hypothetical protein
MSQFQKPSSNSILSTPAQEHFIKRPVKTTKPLRNKDLEDTRAKGLRFWCDEKFVPGHKCKNRKLDSLCIFYDEEDNEDNGAVTMREKIDKINSIHIPLCSGRY